MRSPRSFRTLTFRGAGVVVAGAIALSACGSGYGSHASAGSRATVPSAPAAPAAPAAAPVAAPVTVKVASTGIGQVLVSADGMTLYRFDKDTGTKSTCNGPCAVTWPALSLAGAPSGGAELGGSLAVTTRSDGTSQVTYQGHPLYHYAGDHQPGDTHGDGIGGIWHVVRPGAAPASTTATTAGSSYSY